MNRHDWYFRRLVSAEDMKELEGNVELDITEPLGDVYGAGVLQGTGVVSQHSPSPDISIDIGVTVAYDSKGFRSLIPTTINVLMDRQGALPLGTGGSGDGSSITVPSAGYERWVSVYLYFDRRLQDPQIDGFGQVIMFHMDDSYVVKLVAGVTSATGVAVRPPANPGDSGVLLADVLLHDSNTQIYNGDVDQTRVTRIYPLSYYIHRTGDTMTGFLTLNDDPVQDLHSATKRYVDDRVTSFVPGITAIPVVPLIAITAVGDLKFGDTVYKDGGTLTYRRTSNLSKATMPAVAVVTQIGGILNGQVGAAASLGVLTNSAWGWVPGGKLFVGVDGLLTTTPPSVPGSVVQVVGVAHAADTILFELGTPFIN